MEHRTVSIADQIFEQLERDILIGEYEVGEVLTESRLSEKLGVSRTPIREALRRLEQEHIIEESSRGAVVVGITKSDMADIYEIRKRLEGLAARKAAENATEEDIENLRKIVDLQEFYTAKKDADSIKNADTAFHESFYKCSRSPNLYYTLIPLHKKAVKYRKASMMNSSRASDSLAEHKEIFDAIVKRDPDAAEKAALQHVIRARDSIFDKE